MKKTTIDPRDLLPEGLLKSDTKYPGYDKIDRSVGDHGQLTFYLIGSAREYSPWWALTTLRIANGKRGNADRSYAIRVSDGAPVRVGQGPNVLKTVTVYASKPRAAAFAKYAALYQKGLAEAGIIRDRISSRRAEGSLRRARGERSWRWST